MTASALDEIAGVGVGRAKSLLRHFGSLAKLKEASLEQIARVPGVGEGTARTIHASLHPGDGILES